MASQPNIVSRAGWGATRGIPAGRNVPLSSRRWFVAHWPVMGARDERQWCRDIDRIHRGQGWAVIGYNYLVGQSGQIYEGAGLMTRGIHSPPRNVDGFGVCFLQPSTAAGTPTAPMSQAMRNSGRALYEWLSSRCGRRLGMSWHGQHHATACPGPDVRRWVQQGMPGIAPAPAPAPAPTPQPERPPQPEEIEMMCSALADDGTLHVWSVGPQRRTAWLTFQKPNTNGWHGGQAGKRIAGMSRFADAPQGRTIRGISAEKSASGVLHFFATYDNGDVAYAFQRKGETSWSGAGGGAIAGLARFAPWG